MVYRLFHGHLPKAVSPRRYFTRMLRRPDSPRAVFERVHSALNTLADDLLIVDTKGCLVLTNQRFADLLGPQQASGGQPLNGLAWQDKHGNPPAAGSHPWEIALNQGAPLCHHRVWLTDGRGVRHAFLAHCSPIITGKGKPGGVTIALEDVTGLDADRIEPHHSGQEIKTVSYTHLTLPTICSV